MKATAIDTAKRLMSKRNFGTAIRILQSHEENYMDSFEFYCTLAIACLYAGDIGTANSNFEIARKMKVSDVNLLLGQAAVFLRHCDTERAIHYYLDVLELEPENKTAKAALEFIRTDGSAENICRWVDSGKIEKFYPSLGVNVDLIAKLVLSAIIGICFGYFVVNLLVPKNSFNGPRDDLSSLALTVSERKNAGDPREDVPANIKSEYIYSDAEIAKIYNNAAEYFHKFNDNACQVELNKILNSNAVPSIKKKARLFMNYLSEPGFDNLKQNYDYQTVEKAPELYLDCFADWSGRIANVEQTEDSIKFILLVGYEDQKNVLGSVPVKLDFIPVPELDPAKPVRVLGRITTDSGRITLKGKSVFQSVKE